MAERHGPTRGQGPNLLQGPNRAIQNYVSLQEPNVASVPVPAPAVENNKIYAQIEEAI